jgi:hypothetical protein
MMFEGEFLHGCRLEFSRSSDRFVRIGHDKNYLKMWISDEISEDTRCKERRPEEADTDFLVHILFGGTSSHTGTELLSLESLIDRVKGTLQSLEVWLIVGRFCVFIELYLYFLDVGFELFADEREIYECRECPSDESDHDRRSDEGSKSTSDSGDEVGPEHLPGRADILHEFVETR